MRNVTIARVGGVFLIGGALAFMGAFAFLAVVSAVAMMLGLLRWPSIHWTLARAYAAGTEAERAAISATFAGLNSFLGNYVGEFLGEFCFSLFFLLSGLAMLARESRFPHWVGYLGVFTAVAGMIGMFRNVTVSIPQSGHHST